MSNVASILLSIATIPSSAVPSLAISLANIVLLVLTSIFCYFV